MSIDNIAGLASSLNGRLFAQAPADNTVRNQPADKRPATTMPGTAPSPDPSMPPSSPAVPSAATTGVAGAVFGSLANLGSDLDILNFALTLEYLEADFYNRVVEANNAKQYLRGRLVDIAGTLARDETAHVDAILKRITDAGGTPVAKPMFQFPSETFISPIAFLSLAAQLEGTGVGAYLAAAPLVQKADNLKFAASIYGIEARHTGLIRFVAGMPPVETSTESPLSVETIAARIQPLIASGAPGGGMAAM